MDPLRNTDVFKGQNLKLKVKYEGCPTPTCKWTRNGKEVSERRGVEMLNNDSEGTKELVIYDVNDMHSGEYACKLENAAGSEVTKCTVKVKGQFGGLFCKFFLYLGMSCHVLDIISGFPGYFYFLSERQARVS